MSKCNDIVIVKTEVVESYDKIESACTKLIADNFRRCCISIQVVLTPMGNYLVIASFGRNY